MLKPRSFGPMNTPSRPGVSTIALDLVHGVNVLDQRNTHHLLVRPEAVIAGSAKTGAVRPPAAEPQRWIATGTRQPWPRRRARRSRARSRRPLRRREYIGYGPAHSKGRAPGPPPRRSRRLAARPAARSGPIVMPCCISSTSTSNPLWAIVSAIRPSVVESPGRTDRPIITPQSA